MSANDAPSDHTVDPQHLRTSIEMLLRLEPELVICDMPLSDLTTFRIGGTAAAVCRVSTPEAALRFRTFAAERHLPCVFLGGGSNILAADEGYRGLVLKMEDRSFEVRGENLVVGAGLPFDEAITRSLAAGLTGLEFASGVPGTVGGAIVGNAGCYGGEIGEAVVDATVLRPDGNIVTLAGDEIDFAYRRTSLSDGGDLLLRATLRLRRQETSAAEARRAEHLADRARKHPVDLPSAGSFFRNLPPERTGERRRAAGALLEAAGAGAMAVGGAAVFERHANIIVNRRQATAGDVLSLARTMRDAVRDRFGVELAAEVRYLPGGEGGRLRPAI